MKINILIEHDYSGVCNQNLLFGVINEREVYIFVTDILCSFFIV